MALKRSRSSSANSASAKAVAQRVQRLHQRHAVAQPGQRIARQRGAALGACARFASLRCGDVGEQAQAVGRHVLFADDGGAQFQPAIRPPAPRARNSSRKARPGRGDSRPARWR